MARAPGPSLFPYTTLFRSRGRGADVEGAQAAVAAGDEHRAQRQRRVRARAERVCIRAGVIESAAAADEDVGLIAVGDENAAVAGAYRSGAREKRRHRAEALRQAGDGQA